MSQILNPNSLDAYDYELRNTAGNDFSTLGDKIIQNLRMLVIQRNILVLTKMAIFIRRSLGSFFHAASYHKRNARNRSKHHAYISASLFISMASRSAFFISYVVSNLNVFCLLDIVITCYFKIIRPF